MEKDAMKVYLEFDFDKPEERDDHQAALNGYKYQFILQDLDNWLRNKSKYQEHSTVTIEEVRKFLVDECEDRNVRIHSG